MEQKTHIHNEIRESYPPRICWSAIFAGALVGLGLGFLLELYAVAIGLSAYQSSGATAGAIAIGGFLALIVAAIASMGVAGFLAGYLGKHHYGHQHGGVVYGFLTWSVSVLLAAILFMPLTHYVAHSNMLINPKVASYNSLSENTTTTTSDKGVSKKTTTLEATVTPETAAGTSWVVFVLFFIGALASCIGACYGMRCHKECDHTTGVYR